jgi:type I restriction enzyme S subunit
MEVKKGYKQTEVGVIPEDWEVKRLKDISPCQSVGLVINPSTFYSSEGTVPIFVGSNISEHKIDWESAKKITTESNQLLSASRLSAGDIVMVRVGAPGVSAVVPQHLDGSNCASMMIVRRHSTFNSAWLCWFMNSRVGRVQVEGVQYGTAQKQFNISDAVNFKYPVPTLAEQETIAGALSDADAWIESLEQLIAKKRQIKQGAMQELLTGKTRLPGFTGKWEVRNLGDCCKITTGKKDVNEGNPLGIYPFFTCSRSHTFSDSYSFDTEAILIAGNGDVGNLHYFTGKFEAYQRTYVLVNFNSNVRYLWHQLSADLISSLGIGKIGSSIPYIKKENLANFEFNCPCNPTDQNAIATVLSDMDSEIESLETKLAKARQIKQGMMQELLTGRIRLV